MMEELKKRAELEALITEREGMLAENEYRRGCGVGPAYTEGAFMLKANQMRELFGDPQ